LKAGYLVKYNTSSPVSDWLLDKEYPVNHDTVGLVMEVIPDILDVSQIWVRWHGNWDWDISYPEDLEIVSCG